jgi:hypothetical protein
MVLVRQRGTKQSQDPIAGRLHDVAVETAHRVDHQFERRIDDHAGLLRIEPFLQFRGPGDVCEQRGDSLPLAVGCSCRIGGLHRQANVVDARACARRQCGPAVGAQRRAAIAAELLTRCVRFAA